MKKNKTVQKRKDDVKTYWLISSNDQIFRIEDCLSVKNIVDWQGSFSPKRGDIVFIYRSKPIQRICYMMEVVEINIPYRNTINDTGFWGKKHTPLGTIKPEELYHRLKLLKKTTSPKLHLKELHNLGMKGVPLGRRKLSGNLLDYILKVFELNQKDYVEIENAEGYYEGALKKNIRQLL